MADSDEVNVFDQDKKFIVIILTIISFLSFFSSALIIITYICFKKIRNYAYKLVCFLSFGNIILNMGNILSVQTLQNQEDDSTCTAQAFMVNYGGLATIVWTSVIAWSIFSATVLSAKNLRQKNLKFVLFGFGVPLILSIIPFITDQYGRAGFYCWIKYELTVKDTIMTFVQFYIPLWIALAFNIYAYIKVVRFIKKYISTTLEVRFIQRLKYYPLVLVFCWTLATINRIYNIFGNEIIALTFLSVALGSLQGFLNAVIFATNDQVRQIWKEKFCCCCFGPSYSKYEGTELKKNEEMQQNQDQDEHHEPQESQEPHEPNSQEPPEDIQSQNDDANNASIELVQTRGKSKKKGGLKGTKLAIRV